MLQAALGQNSVCRHLKAELHGATSDPEADDLQSSHRMALGSSKPGFLPSVAHQAVLKLMSCSRIYMLVASVSNS